MEREPTNGAGHAADGAAAPAAPNRAGAAPTTDPASWIGAPLDVAVPCVRCGCNLQGLSGDPIRCPECGEYTPVNEATPRQYAIEQRRRRTRARLETGASLCAIATGAALVFGALVVVFAEFYHPIRRIPLLTCAAVWLTGACVQWATCRGLPGWKRAFIRHQLYGVPAGLGNVLLILGTLLIAVAVFSGGDASPECVVFVAAFAAVGVVRVRPMRLLSRRASAALEPLVEAKSRMSA